MIFTRIPSSPDSLGRKSRNSKTEGSWSLQSARLAWPSSGSPAFPVLRLFHNLGETSRSHCWGVSSLSWFWKLGLLGLPVPRRNQRRWVEIRWRAAVSFPLLQIQKNPWSRWPELHSRAEYDLLFFSKKASDSAWTPFLAERFGRAQNVGSWPLPDFLRFLSLRRISLILTPERQFCYLRMNFLRVRYRWKLGERRGLERAGEAKGGRRGHSRQRIRHFHSRVQRVVCWELSGFWAGFERNLGWGLRKSLCMRSRTIWVSFGAVWAFLDTSFSMSSCLGRKLEAYIRIYWSAGTNICSARAHFSYYILWELRCLELLPLDGLALVFELHDCC